VRLVLFPTWLLLDLLGVVMLSTFGYEQNLKDGYWQIPLEENIRQYTAFTVPGKGIFQWRVMPFGLHPASAMFQRVLDQVSGPEESPHAFAYQDDIIVIGCTLEEHKRNLREVFRCLKEENLRLNPEK